MTYFLWYIMLSFLLTPIIAQFCSTNTKAVKRLIVTVTKELELARDTRDTEKIQRLETYVASLQKEVE